MTRAFRTAYLRLSGREPFFCVVDAASGIPPTIALRFALRQRRRCGVRGLERRMQAVAQLYTVYHVASGGRDLEADLQAGVGPTLADFGRAVRVAERAERAEKSPGATGWIAGAIAPGALGGVPHYLESSRAFNRRLARWAEFVTWALQPAHWATRGLARSLAEDAAVSARITDFREFVAGELRPEPASVHYLPLTAEEVSVVESVLADDAPNPVFSNRTLKRNRSMYYVCRYGGLRRGETLTLQCDDLPSEASGLTTLCVTRRPSNPAETRGRNAPAVKRGGRTVLMPTFVVDELRDYVAQDRGHAPTPFVFVSTRGAPLSISAMQAAITRLGAAAGKVFDTQHPGTPHTLEDLHWHRLRHTRAIELLDEYVPEPPAPPVPGGTTAFLDYFGWATEQSAGPYIRTRLRDRADRRLTAHDARLARSSEPVA